MDNQKNTIYPKVYPEDYYHLINRIFWSVLKARSNHMEALSNSSGDFDEIGQYISDQLNPGFIDDRSGKMWDIVIFYKDMVDNKKNIEPIQMRNLLSIVNPYIKLIEIPFLVYPYSDDMLKDKFDDIPFPEDVIMSVDNNMSIENL